MKSEKHASPPSTAGSSSLSLARHRFILPKCNTDTAASTEKECSVAVAVAADKDEGTVGLDENER